MRGAETAMNLIALDLPDEIIDWTPWLEQHLVGVHLRDLVQQLEAIQATPNQPMKLDTVLANNLDAVLLNGLNALDERQVVTLVRYPRLLIELQQLVLERGGEYWSSIPRMTAHTDGRHDPAAQRVDRGARGTKEDRAERVHGG